MTSAEKSVERRSCHKEDKLEKMLSIIISIQSERLSHRHKGVSFSITYFNKKVTHANVRFK